MIPIPLILLYERDADVGPLLVSLILALWHDILGRPTPDLHACHTPAELVQWLELSRTRPTMVVANATLREPGLLSALLASATPDRPLPATILYREGGTLTLGQHAEAVAHLPITVLEHPIDLDDFTDAFLRIARTLFPPLPRQGARRGRPPNSPPNRWRRYRNRHGVPQWVARRHRPQCPDWWEVRPRL